MNEDIKRDDATPAPGTGPQPPIYEGSCFGGQQGWVCPRCGSREWVPMPRFGKFAAYCKHCLKQVDMANWRKE